MWKGTVMVQRVALLFQEARAGFSIRKKVKPKQQQQQQLRVSIDTASTGPVMDI